MTAVFRYKINKISKTYNIFAIIVHDKCPNISVTRCTYLYRDYQYRNAVRTSPTTLLILLLLHVFPRKRKVLD